MDETGTGNEVNVLALVKGEERFLFMFDDKNRDETLRTLARFAADPELDFSWYDAAMLSRKIREALPDPAPLSVAIRANASMRGRR